MFCKQLCIHVKIRKARTRTVHATGTVREFEKKWPRTVKGNYIELSRKTIPIVKGADAVYAYVYIYFSSIPRVYLQDRTLCHFLAPSHTLSVSIPLKRIDIWQAEKAFTSAFSVFPDENDGDAILVPLRRSTRIRSRSVGERSAPRFTADRSREWHLSEGRT